MTEEEPQPTVVSDTELAKGVYETFYERNKDGIQYVDLIKKIYYISRSWTLRGPVPYGTTVEHTGLSGYGRKQAIYDAQGFKRVVKERSGGSHSKRNRRRD